MRVLSLGPCPKFYSYNLMNLYSLTKGVIAWPYYLLWLLIFMAPWLHWFCVINLGWCVMCICDDQQASTTPPQEMDSPAATMSSPEKIMPSMMVTKRRLVKNTPMIRLEVSTVLTNFLFSLLPPGGYFYFYPLLYQCSCSYSLCMDFTVWCILL